LCGAIKYTCSAPPVFSGVCHCQACQKSTGSSFSSIVAVPKEAFHVEGGELKSYEDIGDSGKPIFRYFCPHCGTTVYAETAMRPGLVMVKTGTLDGAAGIPPQAHVYWRDHNPWLESLLDVPRFEIMPPPV